MHAPPASRSRPPARTCRRCGTWHRVPRRCFNGAAASQPRNLVAFHPLPVRFHPLQWGRGFSAAESTWRGSGRPAHRVLQWGRGFSAAESAPGSTLTRSKSCAGPCERLPTHTIERGHPKQSPPRSSMWTTRCDCERALGIDRLQTSRRSPVAMSKNDPRLTVNIVIRQPPPRNQEVRLGVRRTRYSPRLDLLRDLDR